MLGNLQWNDSGMPTFPRTNWMVGICSSGMRMNILHILSWLKDEKDASRLQFKSLGVLSSVFASEIGDRYRFNSCESLTVDSTPTMKQKTHPHSS